MLVVRTTCVLEGQTFELDVHRQAIFLLFINKPLCYIFYVLESSSSCVPRAGRKGSSRLKEPSQVGTVVALNRASFLAFGDVSPLQSRIGRGPAGRRQRGSSGGVPPNLPGARGRNDRRRRCAAAADAPRHLQPLPPGGDQPRARPRDRLPRRSLRLAELLEAGLKLFPADEWGGVEREGAVESREVGQAQRRPRGHLQALGYVFAEHVARGLDAQLGGLPRGAGGALGEGRLEGRRGARGCLRPCCRHGVEMSGTDGSTNNSRCPRAGSGPQKEEI